VPTTDTLHFLGAPTMTALAPTGAVVRTPVTTGGFGDGGDGQATGAQWRHKLTTATNVTGGEVRVWIEILEPLLHFPSTPLQQACTWLLRTEVGIGSGAQFNCINEPAGPIQTGVKELVFNLVLDGPIPVEANETLTVTLERSAFSASANNAVDALSGSPDRDSRITLNGLKEPLVA
jgi:hypothetical protein